MGGVGFFWGGERDGGEGERVGRGGGGVGRGDVDGCGGGGCDFWMEGGFLVFGFFFLRRGWWGDWEGWESEGRVGLGGIGVG